MPGRGVAAAAAAAGGGEAGGGTGGTLAAPHTGTARPLGCFCSPAAPRPSVRRLNLLPVRGLVGMGRREERRPRRPTGAAGGYGGRTPAANGMAAHKEQEGGMAGYGGAGGSSKVPPYGRDGVGKTISHDWFCHSFFPNIGVTAAMVMKRDKMITTEQVCFTFKRSEIVSLFEDNTWPGLCGSFVLNSW